MQGGGAEIGNQAEVAHVAAGADGEATAGGKLRAHRAGVIAAGLEPPGRDDLVADIFVNLAAVLDDGRRKIGEDRVEKIEKALASEPLGGGGGRAEVDEQQRALFEPGR